MKGVSDTEIKVTSISTLTQNPLGTNISNAYNDGINTYFAWRNDEGGIYGRKLVLANKRDDQLVKNDEQAQAMISEDDTFAAFVSTLLFTGATTLDAAGVPTFGWNIHPEFGGKRNLFGNVAPGCSDCTSPAGAYIAKQLGVTKIGVIAYGTSENSKNAGLNNKLSIDQYGPSVNGAQVVYFNNNLPFGLGGGVAPQVSEMKSKGVQLILSSIDINGMKVLGDELKKQGMDDVVMVHPNTYNADFVAANAAIFDGDIVTTGFVPFEAKIDSELQRKFFEYTDKLSIKREELTLVGFLNANLLFTGLLAAGPQFDRAKVVDALRNIHAYTADGLSQPIDWGRQIALPTKDNLASAYDQVCLAAVQVKGGVFVQWSGTEGKPWLCWPQNLASYAEPTIESFTP